MKDQIFLKRALELAALGTGRVSPNPMVGCVIVYNDVIIGEGWHKVYGGPHAEVNAINSVKDKDLLSESTVYVTLEPCSHFGKTPPCADLLIKHNVKKVVVSNLDINPLVSGMGMEKLRKAGILVESGALEEEGEDLNKRFFTFFRKNRPYIILKWAETADGFIAKENYDSKWISNDLSRKLVHKWRAEEDAILVGTNTALYDDPQLNVRDWEGKDPLRLVIDRKLRLPQNLKLFTDAGKTFVFNTIKDNTQGATEYVRLNEDNLFHDLLENLQQRKILSLIVEGGAQILNEFIKLNLWDEARVFKSRTIFNSGIEAPAIRGRLQYVEDILDDRLFVYKLHK